MAKSLYKLPVRGLAAKFLYEMSRFARAGAVDMHMDMSPEPFHTEMYKENAKRPSRGHRFVRACGAEMDMDISPEPFCVDFFQWDRRAFPIPPP